MSLNVRCRGMFRLSAARQIDCWVADLQGLAMNKKLTRKWSLFRTGVTTDNFTPKGAIIMVASVALYAIIQVAGF